MAAPRDPGPPTQPGFDAAPLRGRPTSYRPEFCDRVVEEMAKGFSFGAFAGLISVNRSTLKEWVSTYPEFSAAVTRARAARLVQWERAAMKSAFTQDGGNSTIIIFGLKNAGRSQAGEEDEWADKIAQDVNLRGLRIVVENAPDAGNEDKLSQATQGPTRDI